MPLLQRIESSPRSPARELAAMREVDEMLCVSKELRSGIRGRAKTLVARGEAAPFVPLIGCDRVMQR
jgi:hypothetical protein